jgi:hypothetical protein
MGVAKQLTDFLYGTNRVKSRFSSQYPDEIVLAADASKGIKTTGDLEIKRSANWVTSQRAVVVLTDKRIKSGKWDIPLVDIEASQLVKINTTFGPGQVLKVQTKNNEYYQFGMQLNPEWTNQSTLPLTIEKGNIKYSVFSIIVRVALIGYIIYLVVGKII